MLFQCIHCLMLALDLLLERLECYPDLVIHHTDMFLIMIRQPMKKNEPKAEVALDGAVDAMGIDVGVLFL